MGKANGTPFHHFLEIQTEKLTLLLQKLFLAIISMKNGKKPEKQHLARGSSGFGCRLMEGNVPQGSQGRR